MVADQQGGDLHGDRRHGLEGIRRQVGRQSRGHHHDHGLADGARDRQHEAADDARGGGRQDHALNRFRRCGAEAVRALAKRHRHRGHDVVGERRHERNDHDSHDQSGRKRAFRGDGEPQVHTQVAQARRQDERREEPVHDGRNPGEDFEQRLDHGANPGMGVLREIDGRHQADRAGHQHRDDRDQQGTGEHRHGPEGTGCGDLVFTQGDLRRPFETEEEFERRDQLEEPEGLDHQGQHDPDGRQDRDDRRNEQRDEQRGLDPVAGRQLRANPPPAPEETENGNCCYQGEARRCAEILKVQQQFHRRHRNIVGHHARGGILDRDVEQRRRRTGQFRKVGEDDVADDLVVDDGPYRIDQGCRHHRPERPVPTVVPRKSRQRPLRRRTDSRARGVERADAEQGDDQEREVRQQHGKRRGRRESLGRPRPGCDQRLSSGARLAASSPNFVRSSIGRGIRPRSVR